MKAQAKWFLFATMILASALTTACGRGAVAPSVEATYISSSNSSSDTPLRVLYVQQYENRMIGDADVAPWITLVQVEVLSCDELYDGDFNIEVIGSKLRLEPAREFASCVSSARWQTVIASTSELGPRAVIEIDGHATHKIELIDPQY